MSMLPVEILYCALKYLSSRCAITPSLTILTVGTQCHTTHNVPPSKPGDGSSSKRLHTLPIQVVFRKILWLWLWMSLPPYQSGNASPPRNLNFLQIRSWGPQLQRP